MKPKSSFIDIIKPRSNLTSGGDEGHRGPATRDRLGGTCEKTERWRRGSVGDRTIKRQTSSIDAVPRWEKNRPIRGGDGEGPQVSTRLRNRVSQGVTTWLGAKTRTSPGKGRKGLKESRSPSSAGAQDAPGRTGLPLKRKRREEKRNSDDRDRR